MHEVILSVAILGGLATGQNPFTVKPVFTITPAKKEDKKEPVETYAQTANRAYKEGKGLVVFVNCPVREIDGAVSYKCDEFEGNKTPRIIPAWIDGDWFKTLTNELSPDASTIMIRMAVKGVIPRREVPAQPVPFRVQQSIIPVRAVQNC